MMTNAGLPEGQIKCAKDDINECSLDCSMKVTTSSSTNDNGVIIEAQTVVLNGYEFE
jgi:hypothetical protein